MAQPPDGAAGRGDPAAQPGDPAAIAACFEQLPHALFVYMGADKRCVAVNALGRRLLGTRPQLGRTYREAVPEPDGERVEALLEQVWRTGEPVDGREWRFLVDLEDDGRPTEYFLDFSLVPMHDAEGRRTGAVAHVTDVSDRVRARLAEAARAGAAEQRYRAAREVVLELQGNLLPAYLPVLPGVRLAAHYLVAAEDQDAGGDWFDAVALPGGRVALVVGDVVGHGATASAVMGQLRAVLTAFLLEDAGPADALGRLDRFVTQLPGAAATTVCVALLDPATGELEYACAGHPPPLVIAADGGARHLAAPPCGPLGTMSAADALSRNASGTEWLDLDEIVLLYTDGLVERSDRDLRTGQDELRAHAAGARLHREPDDADHAVDRVCRLSLEWMTRHGHHDDVSLIAAQRTGSAAAPLRVELHGVDELVRLRRDLDEWLGELGADKVDVRDVQLAVGEAVSNALEHGYRGGGGRVVVHGEHDPDGRARLTVADQGRWRPPPTAPDLRGRGLVMMRACADSVEVHRGASGTTVLLGRLLHRRAKVGSPVDAYPVAPVARRFEVRVSRPESGPTRLLVHGPLDLTTVEDFRRKVQRTGRGGSLPLEIDLTGVGHLASAGVHALHELAGHGLAGSPPMRLIAPDGCPAAAVLRMTGLDHLITPRPALPGGPAAGPFGQAVVR